MKKVIALLLCLLIVGGGLAYGDTNTGGGCTGNCGGNNGNNGSNGSNGSNGTNGQNGANGSNGSGSSSSSSFSDGDSYSYSAPSLSAAPGTSTGQLGSIFGSISVSDTEEYAKVTTQSTVVVALYRANLIDETVAKEEASNIVKDLRENVKPKRFLSFGWKTRGKHLFNLFGILATDSARD